MKEDNISVLFQLRKVIKPVFLPAVVSTGLGGEKLQNALWKHDGRKSEEWYYPARFQSVTIALCTLPQYTVTSGIKYRPVIIRGTEFTGKDRTLKNVRSLATALGYKIPPVELVGLLAMSPKEHIAEQEGCFGGLVVMHEPVTYKVPAMYAGGKKQLMLYRDGTGKCIRGEYLEPDRGWDEKVGFVFIK